ncbi:uncharacterized protein LOC123015592 [Tribolium madens]|uniref:uncharacterized protein LOC123015592 n=1 Tax=Tribolium madens TaxID=41895 RepID=UPI001CF72752|nr:uncharacterized protein LOC123015592 [Tribolium madens]
MDDDNEKSLCYIEGTVVDKNASKDITELHENVWYRMKPPKQSSETYTSFVTARQIDLIRNMLLGKTALKPFEVKTEKIKETRPPPRRDPDIIPPSINKRKSSVKFLNKSIYE